MRTRSPETVIKYFNFLKSIYEKKTQGFVNVKEMSREAKVTQVIDVHLRRLNLIDKAGIWIGEIPTMYLANKVLTFASDYSNKSAKKNRGKIKDFPDVGEGILTKAKIEGRYLVNILEVASRLKNTLSTFSEDIMYGHYSDKEIYPKMLLSILLADGLCKNISYFIDYREKNIKRGFA